MNIYLYKKTHNKTGLKYLGKTAETDPHEYQGSGKIWKSHIQKHGYDVTTEIIKECESNEEVKYWGKYYSELWNVVESPDWANLKAEEGEGGAYFGHIMSAETKNLQASKARQRKKQTCPNCGITCSINHIKRWHGNNCKLLLDPEKLFQRGIKFRKTKIKCEFCGKTVLPCRYNELHGDKCSSNPKNIVEKENSRIKRLKERTVYTCEHCSFSTLNKTNYLRWHGTNCKHMPQQS